MSDDIAGPASAWSQPNMSTRVAILTLAMCLAALGASTAQATTFWGAKENARAVERRLERRWPKASDIFVNCPTTRKAVAESRCEFRFIEGRQVRQGQAVVEVDGITDQILPPAPRFARECSLDPWNRGPDREVLRLQGQGIPCYLVGTIGLHLAEALDRRPRIPRRFTTAAEDSVRSGFVINRFSCTARARDGAGGAETISREIGFRCVNRFGDEFLYVYKTESSTG